MRHRKRTRRLVGKWEHRKALLRNLLVALFLHERIKTTEAKAKELRRLADKMITLAKRGDLAARRQALSILPDKAVVRKLFSEIKDRYAYRQSGFTRIVRLGPRRGDAAMMVLIELVTDKLEHRRSPEKVKAEEAALAEAPKAEEVKEAEEREEATPEAQAAEGEAPAAEEATPAEEAPAAEGPAVEEAPVAEEGSVSEETPPAEGEAAEEKAEAAAEAQEAPSGPEAKAETEAQESSPGPEAGEASQEKKEEPKEG